MPFIWNDKTYWKRYKINAKIQAKIVLPAFIVSFILWEIFLDSNVPLVPILFVSLLSATTIYALLGIFYLFPNPRIPDTYSKSAQRTMFIIMFLMFCVVLYFFIKNKILIW